MPDLRRLAPGRDAAVFETGPGRIGLDTYDVVTQRMVSHHVRFAEDHAESNARLFRSRHRYVWPSELDLMGRLAGLTLEHRWADFAGAPFTSGSESHVSVYRKG